jgi:hypothetical protein
VKEAPSFDRYQDVMNPLAFQVLNSVNIDKPAIDEAGRALHFKYIVDDFFTQDAIKRQLLVVEYGTNGMEPAAEVSYNVSTFMEQVLPMLKSKYLNIIGIHYNTDFDSESLLNAVNKQSILEEQQLPFTLESAYLIIRFDTPGRDSSHAVACLQCDGIQYIYDSNYSIPILCNWKDKANPENDNRYFHKSLWIGYVNMFRARILAQRDKLLKISWDGLNIEDDGNPVVDVDTFLKDESIERLVNILNPEIKEHNDDDNNFVLTYIKLLKRVFSVLSEQEPSKLRELIYTMCKLKQMYSLYSTPYGKIDSTSLAMCVYKRNDITCTSGGKPIHKCTVEELKLRAKKRGIKVTGLKKADILAKLSNDAKTTKKKLHR